MSLPNPDAFGDHLVFIDESGDHRLARVEPGYPIFVLASGQLAKGDFGVRIGPSLRWMKLRFSGQISSFIEPAALEFAAGN